MAIKERIGAGFVGAAMLAGGLGLVGGCETEDPCALRQAACVDVTLVGKRDDGIGNAVAYRGLQVSIFAPNAAGPQSDVMDGCESGHVYGTQLGAGGLGTTLASTAVPDLLPHDSSYLSPVQGLLSFQLPDSFNAIADNPPSDVVDPIPSNADKITKLKELRDSDPRAIRIIVTQQGQTNSVWDSRCDEALFSTDEWTMKQYYRVGQNKAIPVIAILEGAATSTP